MGSEENITDSLENTSLEKDSIVSNEKSEKEPYEKYKEKFLTEELIPFAKTYDYKNFSENDFFLKLREKTKKYEEGTDTFNIDIFSFSSKELEKLWQEVDGHLQETVAEREKQATMDEAKKIASGKWGYLPDGSLAAKAKNPCVLGGVHGDEITLPQNMARALEIGNEALLSTDDKIGYSNWIANKKAYETNLRGIDESSDMNRPEISDPETQEEKEKILQRIADYDKPFLLDCHNDNSLNNENDPDKRAPLGYISEAGDINHKINLAINLGLSRLVIYPQEAMTGNMIESLRSRKPNSDGMIVEVAGNDKEGSSAKIALKFLQLSKGLSNKRPSNGIQLLHEFQTTFLPRNTKIKIFKAEIISENELGTDENAIYQNTNGIYIKITKLEYSDQKLKQTTMTEEDKKYFTEQQETPESETSLSAEVEKEKFEQTYFNIMINDIATSFENGPYTEMRKKIIEQYGFDYDQLVSISQEEIPDEEKIEKAQKLMGPLFEKIWTDHQKSLNSWKDLFTEQCEAKKPEIQKCFSDLEKFYGEKFQTKKIKDTFVPHPQNDFMADPREETGYLTHYLPDFEKEKDPEKATTDIIIENFHEMSHQQFQDEKKNPRFTKIKESFETNHPDLYRQVREKLTGNEIINYDLTKEVLTNYIDAYLGRKYFGYKKTEDIPKLLDTYNFQPSSDTSLIEEYFANQRELDEEFLTRLFEEILKQ